MSKSKGIFISNKVKDVSQKSMPIPIQVCLCVLFKKCKLTNLAIQSKRGRKALYKMVVLSSDDGILDIGFENHLHVEVNMIAKNNWVKPWVI